MTKKRATPKNIAFVYVLASMSTNTVRETHRSICDQFAPWSSTTITTTIFGMISTPHTSNSLCSFSSDVFPRLFPQPYSLTCL